MKLNDDVDNRVGRVISIAGSNDRHHLLVPLAYKKITAFELWREILMFV